MQGRYRKVAKYTISITGNFLIPLLVCYVFQVFKLLVTCIRQRTMNIIVKSKMSKNDFIEANLIITISWIQFVSQNSIIVYSDLFI